MSTGSYRDVLIVELNLIGLDITEHSKRILQQKIPAQLPLDGNTQALNTVTEAAESITTVATLGTTISQLVMAGSLSQLWGMINGLQIFVHLPLFDV